MKIEPYDRDIDYLYYKIEKGKLDLQPDFQRAEVWKSPKKKLLIDTILRGWHVPPVHIIYDSVSGKQEVLDGQQRLNTIFSYKNDEFRVDGNLEPFDEFIHGLDGKKYSELPIDVQRHFDSYNIRVFEIQQYNQGEPGELFNRLNESLKLTSAEKRNAYVGELRSQIKHLVSKLQEFDVTSSFLGFSNQRLAYHDLFVKLCFLLENNSLFSKYTEKDLNKLARDDTPFSQHVIDSLEYAIEVLSKIKNISYERDIKLHITKATIFSWLYLIAELHMNGFSKVNVLVDSFINFESKRYKHKNNIEFELELESSNIGYDAISSMFLIFNERATSRVSTASSLAIRDIVISMFIHLNSFEEKILPKEKEIIVVELLETINNKNVKVLLEEYAEDIVWGA